MRIELLEEGFVEEHLYRLHDGILSSLQRGPLPQKPRRHTSSGIITAMVRSRPYLLALVALLVTAPSPSAQTTARPPQRPSAETPRRGGRRGAQEPRRAPTPVLEGRGHRRRHLVDPLGGQQRERRAAEPATGHPCP